MFSNEQIFVWDIDALMKIAKNPTPRNMLDASVRLRRILTDSGCPLLHKVSKGRDFKPRFRILDHEQEKPPIIEGLAHHWTTPDPAFAPHLRTKEIVLDDFLAKYMGSTKGNDLTIKEMIN